MRFASVIVASLALYLSGCATMPFGSGQKEEAPEVERTVGIGYSLWFPPQDWADAWAEPTLGHYSSADPAVIGQHAEWLAHAGVDFVWLDWSNNILAHERPELQAIEEATDVLFDVFAAMDTGPQISIFLGIDGDPAHVTNGNLSRKADQVYNDYVNNPKYAPLLFQYLDKPLLVIYAGTPCPWSDGLPEWSDDRFTVRWMTGFIDDQVSLLGPNGESRYGYWSWWDRTPQSYALYNGRPENMAVSAAYPGSAGWGEEGTQGRDNGNTFFRQWQRVRELDPRFVLINSWNEWVAPEEIDAEFSNDLEPSVELGTDYANQLRDQIRGWKALPLKPFAPPAPQPVASPPAPEPDAIEVEEATPVDQTQGEEALEPAAEDTSG